MNTENTNRGIIIAPSLDLNIHRDISYLGTIHPDTFKKYLLYFDKIDIPHTTRFSLEPTPDDLFLESAGILEHTVHQEGTSLLESRKTDSSLIENALKTRHSMQPGQWSLANHSTATNENQHHDRPGLEIKIYDCLPIPNHDLAFDDILTYKEKRKDELLELRNELDKLYQQVLAQPDTERGLITTITNLRRSIENVNASASKGFFRRVASSFTISLNVESTYSVGAAILTGDRAQLIKEALGFISFEPAKIFTATDIPKDLKAFSYLINLKTL